MPALVARVTGAPGRPNTSSAMRPATPPEAKGPKLAPNDKPVQGASNNSKPLTNTGETVGDTETSPGTGPVFTKPKFTHSVIASGNNMLPNNINQGRLVKDPTSRATTKR